MCASGDEKCSFFGKFGVFSFLKTPVLRFALLPYYRRFHTTSLFLYPLKIFQRFLMFSGGIWREQWNEMVNIMAFATPFAVNQMQKSKIFNISVKWRVSLGNRITRDNLGWDFNVRNQRNLKKVSGWKFG